MGIILRYIILGLVIYLGFLKLKKIVLKNYAPDNSEGLIDDPYIILSVSRKSSSEDIKTAYKREMAKYHPDKVEHLGEDLKKLAIKKTKEISWAYDQLNK